MLTGTSLSWRKSSDFLNAVFRMLLFKVEIEVWRLHYFGA